VAEAAVVHLQLVQMLLALSLALAALVARLP